MDNEKSKNGILVIGASGFIGSYLYEYLKKKGKMVLGTYNENPKPGLIHYDLAKSTDELPIENFKYVVICSGIAKIDKCKENPDYSYLVNVEGVKRIIKEAFKKGAIPVFISSATVFDGMKGNYKENDAINPTTIYGEHRAEVEDFILSNFKDYLIIRPGKIFGIKKNEGVLFRTWLDKYEKEEIIKCADDEKLSPTYVEDLARGIAELLERDSRGIYHINSPGYFSRYELALDFFRHLNINDAKIIKCSIDDFDFLEKRPKETYLNIDKFNKETGFRFTELEKCYKIIKEDYESENKKFIYVAQFGTDSNINLLPLSAGLLVSRLKQDKELIEKVNIGEIKFRKEDIDELVSRLENVSVMGFSCYIWNINYSLEVAKKLKEKFPKALIIFGGSSVPCNYEDGKDFLEKNPFIDVISNGEGEKTFLEICKAHLKEKDFSKIPCIMYKNEGRIYFNDFENLLNLENLPSPYLDGTFDELYKKYKDNFSGAILEVTRGCPYNCAYCEWGGKSSKIREFSLERLKGESEWIGKNKINYIAMADSNFGICSKDLELVKLLAESKKKYGCPNYISVSWVKNSSDKVLEMSKILKDAGIGFKITLSLQSLNKDVLKAINRININMDEFKKIKEAYRNDGAYSYTEFIHALPRETYESFIDGIEISLSDSIFDQIYIYPLFLLPNTELAKKENISKYGFETVKIEAGYTKRKEKPKIKEYGEVVIATKDMPREKWVDSFVIGNFTLALYDNRLAFFILNFLKKKFGLKTTDFIIFLEKYSQENLDFIKGSFSKLRNHGLMMQKGMENNLIKPEFYGEVPFDPPEAIFLELLNKKEKFFQELLDAVKSYLNFKNIDFDYFQIQDLFRFQEAVINSPDGNKERELNLYYNWVDYFKYAFQLDSPELTPLIRKLKIVANDYNGDRQRFLKDYFDTRGVPIFNELHEGEKKVFPPIKLR